LDLKKCIDFSRSSEAASSKIKNISGASSTTDDVHQLKVQPDRQSEDYRVALFLYSIGQEAVKTYNSFDMSEENRRKLAEIIKEFDNYTVGETNETYEH